MTLRSGLAGEVAMVTGAGGGIGSAVASLLVARGAQVVVTDVSADAAHAVAERLGSDAVSAHVDVRDPDSVAAAVDLAVTTYGRLTIGINSAGVGVPVPGLLHEWSDTDWRRVLDVNLDGAFHSARAQLAAMVGNAPDERGRRGALVMVGSIGSVVGLPGAATYVTAKHGLLGMTRSIAIDYASFGIRANLVAPGYVDTEISPRTEQQKQELAAKHPLESMASVDEVAAAIVHLASAESSFTTGSCLTVDGGYTAR